MSRDHNKRFLSGAERHLSRSSRSCVQCAVLYIGRKPAACVVNIDLIVLMQAWRGLMPTAWRSAELSRKCRYTFLWRSFDGHNRLFLNCAWARVLCLSHVHKTYISCSKNLLRSLYGNARSRAFSRVWYSTYELCYALLIGTWIRCLKFREHV